MPVYEYECPQCAKVHEVQQRMTDDPLTVCPECGGEVKKLISMSSFQLKGGGWYADGYSGGGANGKGSAAKKDKKASTAPAPSCQGGKSPCAGCPSAAS